MSIRIIRLQVGIQNSIGALRLAAPHAMKKPVGYSEPVTAVDEVFTMGRWSIGGSPADSIAEVVPSSSEGGGS